MIRKDREVPDISDILDIISRCDVCRLGLNGDDGYPYIVPLNFGYEYLDGVLSLYFHSALKGRKHDLISADSRASFEMDCNHKMLSSEDRGYCTMNYECVMGYGHICYITDEEEKCRALTLMTDRYHTSHFDFNHASIPRTSVYKLVVENFTAKRKASVLS